MIDKKYYYCYSKPLMEFLTDNGLHCVLFDQNPKTLKLFWVFKRTKILSMLLNEWSERKANSAFLMDKNGRKEDKYDEF